MGISTLGVILSLLGYCARSAQRQRAAVFPLEPTAKNQGNCRKAREAFSAEASCRIAAAPAHTSAPTSHLESATLTRVLLLAGPESAKRRTLTQTGISVESAAVVSRVGGRPPLGMGESGGCATAPLLSPCLLPPPPRRPRPSSHSFIIAESECVIGPRARTRKWQTIS